jgi:dUTP pyrophosphatase
VHVVRTTPFVYLARPIDFVLDDDVDDVHVQGARVVNMIKDAGVGAYCPGSAFRLPKDAKPNSTINDINRAALSACGGLIAILPARAQSIGVPREIEQARAEGKPVLVIAPDETINRSWSLADGGPDFAARTEIKRQDVDWLRDRIVHGGRQTARQPATRALYTQLDPGAAQMSRAYSGDAGFDLYAQEETLVPAGGFVDVPMGCRIQFPDGVWGMITGRSSTVRKLDLLVTVGIIDTGYRGPLFAGVRSLRTDDYLVKKGERLAQLIPFPNLAQTLHPVGVDVLAGSDRGELGFGSSGA